MNEIFHKICIEQMEAAKDSQKESIEKAARLLGDSIANGGFFFVYDRGHLLGNELIVRAGGPAFVRKFDYSLPSGIIGGMAGSTELMRKRYDSESLLKSKREFEDAYIRYFAVQNGLKEGDVLLVNSVSGKSYPATAVARECKKLGIKIIAMCSKNTCDSIQQEGEKKFYEYADVVIDLPIPFGDASMDMEGFDERIMPMSGISAAYLGWWLVLRTMELLKEKGIKPSIYRSVNIEGGEEQVQKTVERFNKLGY